MNTLWFALCCLVCATVGQQLFDPPKMIHLAVTGDPSEMVFTWTTTLPTESELAVEPSEGGSESKFTGSQTTYLPSAGYIHYVKATGLTPETKYKYYVGSQYAGYSSTFEFKTAPKRGSRDDRTIVMYGDMGIFEYAYYTVLHVTELVDRSDANVDFIYQAGDFGYGNDRDAMFYELSWNMFFQQMTRPMTQVPYMVAPGNHEENCGHDSCDFYANNFTVYNTRFKMPYEESGAPTNMWFSFDYGNIHFITISTETDFPNCPYEDDTFGDQLAWLEKDLQVASNSSDTDWIIAVGHQPVYSSISSKSTILGVPKGSSRNVQQAFEELFYNYKVDIYVDGHVHGYERSYPVYRSKVVGNYSLNEYVNPQAPVYIVNGDAGNIEGFYTDYNREIPSWSAKRYYPNPEHGYGLLQTYGASKLLWRFYQNAGEPIDNNYYDYFEIIRN